jgi:signal transduction histidine kinase
VLAALGALLYARLGDSLEEQLDESLEARAAALAGVSAGDRELPGGEESFAQRLDGDGSVLAGSPGVGEGPLVSPEEAARARGTPFFLTRPLDGGSARLLLTASGSGTLVVGAPLEERDEALAGLLGELLLLGPLALVLAAGAAWLLAGAALRPVEDMRRRAAEISTERAERRLPLPDAHDEIRKLGETLNAMLDRLQAGLARERRFVADASHELRTPLALLQAELELALRRPRSERELEAALVSAAEEVDRLVRLAEDLLVLARSDEGRLPLRRSTVPAGELLEAVARRFRPRAAAEGRALETDAGEVEVAGDRLRLEQALANLVDNALRHGAGPVRIDAGAAGGSVELRVTDAGEGFPPAFLPHACDRFTRADEARGGTGAGLGLAVAAAIAEAHGGRIRAANGPRRGAVVTIAVPGAMR